MRRILAWPPLLLFLIWPILPAPAAPTSEAQLIQALEQAIKAKDKPAILALYNWDGVPDWGKQAQSDDADDWLAREFKSAKLAPAPTNVPASWEMGDLRFHLNVRPTAIIQLDFGGFGIGFPCGKAGDTFCIAGLAAEEIPAPPSDPNSLLINVQTGDGQPLRHASVVTGSPDHIPALHFRKLYGDEMLTDGQGRLYLPAGDTNRFLVVANGHGFGWLPAPSVTNHASLILKPWGLIECRLQNWSQAWTNVQLELATRGLLPPARMDTRLDTDGQGRAIFTSVPPLNLLLNQNDKLTGSRISQSPLSVAPGETNQVEINSHGHTIVGHLVRAKGLDTNLDLALCYVALTPSIDDPVGVYHGASFHVSASGELRAEFVEPGNYKLTGSLQGDRAMVGMIESRVVQVPDSPSPVAPFDVGAVNLQPAVNLKTGDLATDFQVQNLEGKPFALSDFHGKYVLLDFWATWCGPCVGETPNMKATYDAFGKDPRFAMISLSLDKEVSAPKRFARSHDIAWTQGFLGDWSSDKVTPTYGVHGIPAIFLIGPDGKILATQLRGTNILATVAANLLH